MVSIYATAASVGILSLILYREGKDRVSRFAFGVLITYAVVLPLGNISGNIFEIPEISVPEAPDTDGGAVYDTAREALEEGIARLICEEFSLNGRSVTVVVQGFSLTEMKGEKIKVFLSGKGAFVDVRLVESFVNKYGFGECEAEFEI